MLILLLFKISPWSHISINMPVLMATFFQNYKWQQHLHVFTTCQSELSTLRNREAHQVAGTTVWRLHWSRSLWELTWLWLALHREKKTIKKRHEFPNPYLHHDFSHKDVWDSYSLVSWSLKTQFYEFFFVCVHGLGKQIFM